MFNNLVVADSILSAIKKDLALAANKEEVITALENNCANLLMAELILTKIIGGMKRCS